MAQIIRYCSPSGSDTTGTGLVGAPWKDIGYALRTMEADVEASGETGILYLQDGAYANPAKTVGNLPDRANCEQMIEIRAVNALGATLGNNEDTYAFGWDGRTIHKLGVYDCNLRGWFGVRFSYIYDCVFSGLLKNYSGKITSYGMFSFANTNVPTGSNVEVANCEVRNCTTLGNFGLVEDLYVHDCIAKTQDSPIVLLKIVDGEAINIESSLPTLPTFDDVDGENDYVLIGTMTPVLRWWMGNHMLTQDSPPAKPRDDVRVANTNASVLSWETWNGSTWVAETITDGTAVAGATFAQPGYITTSAYTPANWALADVADVLPETATLPVECYPLPVYWHRLKFSAALSADTDGWIRAVASDAMSNHNLDAFLHAGPDAIFESCTSYGAEQTHYDLQGTRLQLKNCAAFKGGGAFKLFNDIAYPDTYPAYPTNPVGVRYSTSWDNHIRLTNCMAWGSTQQATCLASFLPYTEIINCTFVGSYYTGMAIAHNWRSEEQTEAALGQIKYRNCIFVSLKQAPMFKQGTTPVNMDYNVYVETGSDFLMWSSGGVVNQSVAQAKADTARYGPHSVWTDDVKFVNQSILDLRIAADSPAVDIGEACANLPALDYFGRTRNQGLAPDAGYYETDGEIAPNRAPSAPVTVTVTPSSPDAGEDLTASAAGSVDPDGDAVTYEYQWAKSTDGGSTYGAWGNDGETLGNVLTSARDVWKARARATDGTLTSSYTESSAVTVSNTIPTVPTTVEITPSSPNTDDDLVVAASGATDADGDSVSYVYQWASSADDITYTAWASGTATYSGALTEGYYYKARARAYDGYEYSDWVESSAVQASNTAAEVVVGTVNIGKNIGGFRRVTVKLTNSETGEVLAVLSHRASVRTDKTLGGAVTALMASITAMKASLGTATTIAVDAETIKAALNGD